jgi:hypothetical protein
VYACVKHEPDVTPALLRARIPPRYSPIGSDSVFGSSIENRQHVASCCDSS